MKLTPFEDILTEFYGDKGSPRRDEHEQAVEAAVQAKNLNIPLCIFRGNIPKNSHIHKNTGTVIDDRPGCYINISFIRSLAVYPFPPHRFQQRAPQGVWQCDGTPPPFEHNPPH